VTEKKPTPQPTTTAARIADFAARLKQLDEAQATATEKQKAKGKNSAMARIMQLVDPGTGFTEIDKFVRSRGDSFGDSGKRPDRDAVIMGVGRIHGREVGIFSQDFSVFGGSLGEAAGAKIVKLQEYALKAGVPIIGILDSGGARIQEGVTALGKYGEIFRLNTQSSGVIPQFSIICGPAAGGAVYSPALTDFVVMVDKTSQMFVTGPDVIKAVTGEDVGMEELGGAATHSVRTGVSHYLASDEPDAFDYVRSVLAYLPQNNLAPHPLYASVVSETPTEADKELDSIIPDSANQPYDMLDVIARSVDEDSFLEVQPLFAPNIVIGFARVEGKPVGVIANQPKEMAGTLNIDASEKAARFVRFCDAFGLPIITLVDVPGFLPGTDQEWLGVIRRGAKLLYAYSEATVPLITVITRKAYGGAYIVMGSKHLGADINMAWPTAELAVMGGQGAVNILYRAEIKEAEDKGEDVAALRAKLASEYTESVASPFLAAERGEIDNVIYPHMTRIAIIRSMRALGTKRASMPAKKHGNIPL
jgi:propionyl-CoA carboxylase beta chain